VEQRIQTAFIRLDALLKLAGLVNSGGEAKQRIQDGEVSFNGTPCTMRGKKCYPEDKIELDGQKITVLGGESST